MGDSMSSGCLALRQPLPVPDPPADDRQSGRSIAAVTLTADSANGTLGEIVDEAELDRLRGCIERAVRTACPRWLAAEAEDLAQEATVKVLRILQRRPAEQPLASSYLWRTAHSEVIDEIRRRRRRRESNPDDEELRSLPDARLPTPERRSESRQLGEAIAQCLRGLIGPRRRAVLLHLQGHALREIGELLRAGAKRVDNLVYRGLADLRDCLSEKGYGR